MDTLFIRVYLDKWLQYPLKKVDDSSDKVESSSTQITEQPADSSAAEGNEHPTDSEHQLTQSILQTQSILIIEVIGLRGYSFK